MKPAPTILLLAGEASGDLHAARVAAALRRRLPRARLIGLGGPRMKAAGVDLLILVDYPGFNLRVARYAHRRGVRVLYYIAPKVWAWREGRARRLAEDT